MYTCKRVLCTDGLRLKELIWVFDVVELITHAKIEMQQ